LLDAEFPEKLARYARAVAQRYPWLDAYTPVNEPLTTSRFSALYGHWYPHAREVSAFARALVNQIKGTVLAMREIRAVNSAAQLIQTEDLGRITSTEPLRYQAEFENERRWLTWDLLCGRVIPTGRARRMWEHLRGAGIPELDLAWFVEHHCPPDVIGVNYYVTSDRFLDHRHDRYPAHAHGGNGRDRYADVETARASGIGSPHSLVTETWQQFNIPIAITECHLWSTREEQLRWLVEVWSAARLAKLQGADVRAVTAWSLFGAYDWNSLLTRDEGHYEIGAFDARVDPPRPTKVAEFVRDLAHEREPWHPLLDVPGWWRHWPVVQGEDALVITGRSPALQDAFSRIAAIRNIPNVVLPRSRVTRRAPWAVLDLGLPDGDALALARVCAERHIPLASFSVERVLEVYPAALVLRTGPFAASSPDDVNDLVHTTLDLLVDGATGLVTLADRRLRPPHSMGKGSPSGQTSRGS
jgi:dTDP-4-dehydrorhamnose reductase